jgi:hypothetical protein
MRRALATTALAAGITLGGAPLLAVPAFAAAPTASITVASPETETDVDEPLAEDGNDDTGKYGLIGLTGLFGLFGYKKYRDHRAAQRRSTGTSGPIGDIDGDGSGSRRV